MDNKGFSLIELVVAIGISGVVILMISFILVQGSKMYSSENDEINVRNDYQIVRSQIEQAVMEAKNLTIVRAGDDIVIYTGDVDESSNRLAAEDDGLTTERIITYVSSEGAVYISSSYDEAVSEGNRICTGVEDFDIFISDNSKKEVATETLTEIIIPTEEETESTTLPGYIEPATEETAMDMSAYYTNPLNVCVKLRLSGETNQVESVINVRVRNTLSHVTIYRTSERSILLGSASGKNILSVR